MSPAWTVGAAASTTSSLSACGGRRSRSPYNPSRRKCPARTRDTVAGQRSPQMACCRDAANSTHVWSSCCATRQRRDRYDRPVLFPLAYCGVGIPLVRSPASARDLKKRVRKKCRTTAIGVRKMQVLPLLHAGTIPPPTTFGRNRLEISRLCR